MLIMNLLGKLPRHLTFDRAYFMRYVTSDFRRDALHGYVSGKPLPQVTKQTFRNFTKAIGKPRRSLLSNKPSNKLKTVLNVQNLQLSTIGLSSLYICKNIVLHANCDSCRVVEKAVQDYESQNLAVDWEGLLALILPDGINILGAIVSAIFVAILNIQIPLVLGDLVNAISSIGKDNMKSFGQLIKEPARELIFCYILQGISTSLFISLLSKVGENVAARLRMKLFNALMSQDVEFFDKHSSGELINRLTSDVQEFKSSFKACISQGIKSFTQTAGCIGTLFVLSPKLTCFLLGVVPTLVGIGTLIGSFLRILSRQAQAQSAKATSIASEAIGNIRTVRAFSMEKNEAALYNRETEKGKALTLRLGNGIAIFQGLSNVALNGVIFGILIAGGHMLSTNELSAGNLMSFLVATQTIERSLAHMSLLFGQAIRGMSAQARIFEFINSKPTIPIVGGIVIPSNSLIGEVTFENVDFSYPTRRKEPVLKNMSLTIPNGKVLALVGHSGSGKSTIASLLERFYDVNAGEIKIDGHNIKRLCPICLRGNILGIINQEPVLFNTTILENIRYGNPKASKAEVYAAAKIANAHSFITTFSHGYHTVVGERGITLSGGQKQRIAIARALIKNPKILILDEATSALDTESEQLVQDALQKVSKGRTVIVIAHRLSTIKDADIIAVLFEGNIVETGSHKPLLDKRGHYYNLVNNPNLMNNSKRPPPSNA